MTDKQIIIDGVNVSECKYYDNGTCCNEDVFTLSCENTNCMYKQLKRKEQECEELKHNYNAIKQCNDNNMQTLDEAIKEKCEAEQELEKVKKQYKCYSCGTCNGKEDYYNLAGHHKNTIKSLHKAQQQLDQLKAKNKQAEQKLERIRDIAEPYKMTIKKI